MAYYQKLFRRCSQHWTGGEGETKFVLLMFNNFVILAGMVSSVLSKIVQNVLSRVSFWILHKNKAHRNQNNIPTLYILEFDSSVFKSVQVSSIFCSFAQNLKNRDSCCHDWHDVQHEPASSVGVIMNTSCWNNVWKI
jgi:hypothetical protein